MIVRLLLSRLPQKLGEAEPAMVHQVRRLFLSVIALCDLAPIDDTYWVQRINTAIPVSGTSVTISDAVPTADQWNLVVLEIVPQ